jgi:L-amino acid N-acyltransferase YncA
VLVRLADPDRDAAGCAAAYAPFVLESVASLEEIAPDRDEFALRIAQVMDRYPWLVAVEDEAMLGFAYASQHRERASYRWAADVSVYVAGEHQRRGVGRALYAELLPMLVAQNLCMACAGITLPNEPSVALHEAFGFRIVGVYERIGWKFGAWRDVGWWQLDLAGGAAADPPPEPLPPAHASGS